MPEPIFEQIDAANIAWLDTPQMIEVDRIMIEDLQIELIQMMENAGRNLAQLALDLFAPSSVTICVGRGGNGGGGLVAARHLANRGVDVRVLTTRPGATFSGVPGHQLAIVERMGVPVLSDEAAAISTPDLVIDALIGYSLRAEPTGRARALIDAINGAAGPTVSLDIPSGLDGTTGTTPGAAIHADATLTLALPKLGLRGHSSVGRLFVGDISVPPAVYTRLGLSADDASKAAVFGAASVVEVAGVAR